MTGRDPKTAANEEDGFLGRWSKRKANARTVATEAAEQPRIDTEAAPMLDKTDDDDATAVAAETNTPKSEDPASFDVDSLPDIDSLGPTSDFRVFMQAGVPSELKTKALRRLWRVKSDLANLDGLIDYGEDLTGSFKVVDHLKTAYEVGRGFLKDEETGDDQVANEAADADDEESQAAASEERKSAADDADRRTPEDVDEPMPGNIEKREG